ncbi:MAG TPA: aminotransferase class V-fold PLP-dependent enzyme [Acidimicrobiia bacterium]|nr:aminotransferase class V-fold PLP-dependent enzyme [Acidimicrobiia bacterium]
MDLPATGIDPDALLALLGDLGRDDVDWRAGRGWSLVYDSPDWHHALVREAAARFADENALSHTAFPSAAHFESRVVGMVASVVAPGTTSHGIFASGGTESTMIALKAYRDRAPSTASPARVVVPVTAHPAFGKAAAYLGLDLVEVAVGDDGLPAVDAVLDAIDDHTVVVGLSAPNYPFGVVDPIAEIAGALRGRGVGVHVDAALGGLFLPFLADAGAAAAPAFGLDVAGVTSVAVDLHKYGYGAKGASVVLFADDDLRHAAYHVSTGWPGGAYASSGVLGTRSVGTAAAAFTAMAALGRAGYVELVRGVLDTTRRLQEGLAERGPLRVIGAPPMSVFAVTSDEIPLGALAHGLQQRGWSIDAQGPPPSIHFIVFPRHAGVVEEFLADLEGALDEARGPGAAPDAPLLSYGVMVRGGGSVTRRGLWAHLDARFDGTGPSAP